MPEHNTVPRIAPECAALAAELVQIVGDTDSSRSVDRIAERLQALRAEWTEDACARIEAADDASFSSDYMLDSKDCMSVLRGTWQSPLENKQPTLPKGPDPLPPPPPPLAVLDVPALTALVREHGYHGAHCEAAMALIEEVLKSVTVQVSRQVRRGYMCQVDFDHEVGEASGGNRIYPDSDDLKKHHKAWETCGVVEVEIREFREVEAARKPRREELTSLAELMRQEKSRRS